MALTVMGHIPTVPLTFDLGGVTLNLDHVGVAMPVNMDPAKKRRRQPSPLETDSSPSKKQTPVPAQATQFGDETEEDRVKALADAEQKNLWEATEVIDMDKA
jgi:hypothetical protein